MRTVIVSFAPARPVEVNALAALCAGGEWARPDLFLLGGVAAQGPEWLEGLAPLGRIRRLTGPALAQRFDLRAHAAALAGALGDVDDALVLLRADEDGNRLAPMLAAVLGCPCLLDVTGFELDAAIPTVSRGVYGMNLKAEYQLAARPVVLTLRDAPQAAEHAGVQPVEENPIPDAPAGWFTALEERPDEEADNIGDARRVLVAGRGMGSEEHLRRLHRLAELMEAQVGYTRPLVQERGMPSGRMLGASGTSVAPELCVVFGASGAAPFAAGVEKSGLLVGVNSDPQALLFSFCDIGVVGDCGQLAAALTEQLTAPGEEDARDGDT